MTVSRRARSTSQARGLAPGLDVDAPAAQAATEAGDGIDPAALRGFLEALTGCVSRGERLSEPEKAHSRQVGSAAALAGVGLPTVVDAYLSATRLWWPELPRLSSRGIGGSTGTAVLVGLGQVALRAVDDALAAVADGYTDARRAVIRRQDALRREIVADLLGGRVDAARTIAAAEQVGLRGTAPHLVAVISAAEPFRDVEVAISWVEDVLRARLSERDVLVGTRDGRLVCVLSTSSAGPATSADRAVIGEVAARSAGEIAGPSAPWRAAVGQAYDGPEGIAASFRDAGRTWDLADRLDWAEPVVSSDQLAVYDVLLRDTEAIQRLVTAVLGPLGQARGGAEPLVATLEAFLSSGAVTTATARRLHLSVRAVTYRLARIRTLTGYDPLDPADRLALQVSVVGSRALQRAQQG